MSGLLLCRVSLLFEPVRSVGSVCSVPLFYSTASKKKWLNRQQNDHFTREAKVQNLRSRAAFKLREIDDKYKLFTPNKAQNVLDLGFAPGSWSEVARQRTDPKSMILGVDILPCEPPTGVSSLQANILSQKTQELIRLYFNKHTKLDDILNDPKNIHEVHGFLKPSTNDTIDPEYEHQLKDEEEYREVFTPDDDNKIPTTQQPIDIILSDMLMNTSGLAIRDHLLSVDLCDAALVTAIDLLSKNGSFVCKLYTGKEDRLFERRMRKVFNTVQRFKPVSSRTESREVYFVGLNKLANVDKFKVFT